MKEIIRPARLGTGAGHPETAEGLTTYQGTRAVAVEVEIADTESLGGNGNMFGAAAEDAAGQSIAGGIGPGQSFIEIPCPHYGKHRSENFLLGKPVFRADIADDGQWYEKSDLRHLP